MDIKLQKDVVKWLLHHPMGKTLFKDLESSAFDSAKLSVSIQTIQAYLELYQKLPPTPDACIAFIQEQEGGKESLELLEDTVLSLFDTALQTSEELAEGKAIELLQRKQLLDLLRSTTPKLLDKDGEPFNPKGFLSQAKRILDFGVLDQTDSFSVLEDIPLSERPTVFPTHLQRLNALTSAGGFHRPQLVVIMAAPKGFKTGTMVSLGMGMTLMGARIAYFDYENGGESIHTRAMQAMLCCTEAELLNASEVAIGGDKTLEFIKEKLRNELKRSQADFVAFSMKQQTSTKDAEAVLMQKKEENGFVADGMFWDYADLMAASRSIETKYRFNIQGVYKDIVEMNKEHSTFSFTQSQVGRNAISKEVIEMSDFAEDIGKAANAHAAFALCRTKDEEAAGMGRLVPVMQRRGKRYDGVNYVALEIEESRQSIEEIALNNTDDTDD